jgi:quinolinate synthase
VNECWQVLNKLGVAGKTIPITYMNSSAAIKAFTGEDNGAVCTSSNAMRAMKWAFDKGEKVLFLPDQHLGRNTAVLSLGLKLEDCVLWNPWKPNGGLTDDQIKKAKVILWRGHCSVHGRFSVENINQVRAKIAGVKVLVHPECQHDVVSNADVVGSTEMIIKTVKESASGSKWAVGTELNLVQRLANENPDKQVVFLDKTVCYCSTMNRIDLPHLVWAMESLVNGRLKNQIEVEEKITKWAKVALERMLALP